MPEGWGRRTNKVEAGGSSSGGGTPSHKIEGEGKLRHQKIGFLTTCVDWQQKVVQILWFALDVIRRGHVPTVCMMPWEFISPFCGLSTCGPGFHVIVSTLCLMMVSKTCLTLLWLPSLSGGLGNVFKVKSGPTSTWRWYVKRIGHNKF